MLLWALALAAAVALAPRVEGRSVAATLAHRLTCTAGASCGRRVDSLGVHRVPNRPPDGLRGSTPGMRAGGASAAAMGVPAARRVVGALARRAWIACIGYRRYRYDRSRPGRLSPLDPMPVSDAAEIANKCLNPYGFLAAP